MSIKFHIETDGRLELAAVFNRLQVTALNEVQKAVVKSSRAVRREAKQRAPVSAGGGKFRRSIGTRFTKDGLTASVGAWLRGRRIHPLSHLLEHGTAPHTITGENKKALKFSDGGVRGSVQHPGSAERPWLFPAWEQERPKYNGRLRDAILMAGRKAKR